MNEIFYDYGYSIRLGRSISFLDPDPYIFNLELDPLSAEAKIEQNFQISNTVRHFGYFFRPRRSPGEN